MGMIKTTHNHINSVQPLHQNTFKDCEEKAEEDRQGRERKKEGEQHHYSYH